MVLSLYISSLDRVLGDASAINGRGDEVTAETERDDVSGFRAKTVIKLKAANRWFATRLLTVQSNDYLIGFKWDDSDRLVLILDFGCKAKMTDFVKGVGPDKITYRFDREVSMPDHGYSSFPRDVPRKPCP